MGCGASVSPPQTQPVSILFTPKAEIVTSEDGVLLSVNEYVLVRSLGPPGHSRVFLVTHRSSRQQFALKMVEKKMRRAVEMNNEVLVLMQLRHRNIANLYEVIEDVSDPDCRIYLIFEYVSGGVIMSLDEKGFGDPKTRLSETQAKLVMAQIVDGLIYLHSHKVIHRDINPDNILITEDNQVKICDFGVSKILNSEEDFLQNNQGTMLFYPPEACRGQAKFSGTFADVWALGVTLFAYIYARTPFTADTQQALFDEIQNKELEFPSGVIISDHLKNLLSRMLTKQIRGRIDLNQIRDHPWLRRERPAMAPSPSTEGTLIQPMPVPNVRSIRSILIVDDVYILRRNAEHLVRDVIQLDQPCRVSIECAETGASALELCQRSFYDFILMDFHLDDPCLDGCEITRRIRQLEKVAETKEGQPRHKTTIIGLTGDDDKEVPEKGKQAGMNHVERKPLHPYTLMKLLGDAGFTITEKARSNLMKPAKRRNDIASLEVAEAIRAERGALPGTVDRDSVDGSSAPPAPPDRPLQPADLDDPFLVELLRGLLRPMGFTDLELGYQSAPQLLHVLSEQLALYEKRHKGLHPSKPPAQVEVLFCNMAREVLRLQQLSLAREDVPRTNGVMRRDRSSSFTSL
eukprot:GGOE01044352.1.p1 GENE.GGOE01044352.1~~GGOE01044352.1.p1  ORF type:complete len:631 (+),score=218.29 GGOE01044352.1:76-1968(+)